MHIPGQFREDSPDVLVGAIKEIQLATLVVSMDEGFDAVHLPMIAREEADGLYLEGHVARGNDIWRRAADGCAAIALFQGPHAYIRPGWFETKRETGKGVPTWNYVAVHCHGRLSAVDDPSWLLSHVTDLSARNEQAYGMPWSPDDAPEGYIDKLLRAIVGLRMSVGRVEGAWKLLQHHPQANRLGVIEGLSQAEDAGAKALRTEMLRKEAAI